MYSIINYSERAIALMGDTKPLKNQLKNLGGRFNPRLSCGAGWIFSKKNETALREFLQSLDFPQKEQSIEASKDSGELYKNTLREYIAEHPESAEKYWVKEALGALKIGKGYFFAQKHEITTRLWFSDEGEELEQYYKVITNAENRKEYFFRENLRKFEFSDDKDFYIIDDNGEIHCGTFCGISSGYPRNKLFEFSAEELEQVKNFHKWQKQLFTKRLNTYIKRWGVEKLSFKTYWANR